MFEFTEKWRGKKTRRSPESGGIRGEISLEKIKNIFDRCADLCLREVHPGGDAPAVWAVWIEGVSASLSVTETVIRPLSRLSLPADPWAAMDAVEQGGVYSCFARRRTIVKDVCADITLGYTALVFEAAGAALCFETRSGDTRSVQPPTVEKSVLGAKDSFVENYRVNTALVRRQLRCPELKLLQTTVGRRSGTPVGVMYLSGVAKPDRVAEVMRRLESIDIDGFTAAGDLEQYLVDRPGGLFPRLGHTERPDRFARALLQGRVGVLADGLPVGFLLPCTLPDTMQVAEDRSRHAAVASALLLVRWGATILSLVLPGLYTAVGMYHPEMIPLPLLHSVIAAKQQVPFTVAAEVLGMLLTFELLQEAGLRLPDPVGHTVSIIGALIVGQSAVEARVISPVAVIVVALSGIGGYTQPSQELGAALRLWRLLLTLCSVALGIYGLAAGLLVLLWRLCSLDSVGVAYLYPLCEGETRRLQRVFLRVPLARDKHRDPALSDNERRQA